MTWNAESADHRPEPRAGARDAQGRRLLRRRSEEAAHRRRQHLDRDRSRATTTCAISPRTSRTGIRAAGGTPMEFNTVSISDGITMGTEGMRLRSSAAR